MNLKLSHASGKAYRHDKSSKNTQDKFAMYAAIVVLLALVVAAYFLYQYRFNFQNTAGLAYVELKQTIVNDAGAVARLSVSIQVKDEDSSWLKEQEASMTTLFRKELTHFDVDSLRQKEGILEFQDELKRKMNLTHKTDKIQDVMVTELLLQDQHDNKLYR